MTWNKWKVQGKKPGLPPAGVTYGYRRPLNSYKFSLAIMAVSDILYSVEWWRTVSDRLRQQDEMKVMFGMA
jgi:hypothetical protein